MLVLTTRIATFAVIASSRLVFKENTTAVLERYPPIEGDQRPQMWNLGTDYVFTCPDRYAAKTLATVVRDRSCARSPPIVGRMLINCVTPKSIFLVLS